MVRAITNREDARLGIGRRINRVVTLESDATGQIVPNIFQLSSGETSLLNLFLSIMRDFDLCGTSFSNTSDIRGIVVVDEIDLHLHAVHQYEVLPQLIKMFPRVQFVVTTHSPLFVLGMNKAFGKNGFTIYRMPQGRQISPEEFSEFGNAYEAFTNTLKFSDDIQGSIEAALKPIVFVEGSNDIKYIQTASKLLEHQELLERIDIRDGDGASNLRKIWDTSKHIDAITQTTLLLFDCDNQDVVNDNRSSLFRRTIPIQKENPTMKGIENLFEKPTLQKAKSYKGAFIDVVGEHTKTKRGKSVTIPEQWTINKDEKTNLCNWLCENGTQEDFKHFQVIFDIICEVLDSTEPSHTDAKPETES